MSRRKDKKKSAGDVKAIFNVKNIHKDVDRDSLIRNLKVDLPPSPSPTFTHLSPFSIFFNSILLHGRWGSVRLLEASKAL